MSENPDKTLDVANTEFGQGIALSQERGVLPGVDPETGEIGGLTFRLLYNMMNGDEKKARELFYKVARVGGYGDVQIHQTLDIRGISRAKDDLNDLIARGLDLEGQPLDLFGRRILEQKIQFHDNVLNEVRQAMSEIEKG